MSFNNLLKNSLPVRNQFLNYEDGSLLSGDIDPLKEGKSCPVSGLIRRYHDRALILATNRCFAYCSFCNRRFFVNNAGTNAVSNLRVDIKSAVSYINANPAIREVIISGGDPLTLDDDFLEKLLKKIRSIPTVKLLRIATRAVLTKPSRVTEKLVSILVKMKPIVICVHFNHPDELTSDSVNACKMFIDRGIPVFNQSVLLKRINDDPYTLAKLCWNLAVEGIRPYYLFQCDRVAGTSVFWVPLRKGIKIFRKLEKLLPAHALPYYAVDLPGKAGKALIGSFTPVKRVRGGYIITGLNGRWHMYPDY